MQRVLDIGNDGQVQVEVEESDRAWQLLFDAEGHLSVSETTSRVHTASLSTFLSFFGFSKFGAPSAEGAAGDGAATLLRPRP